MKKKIFFSFSLPNPLWPFFPTCMFILNIENHILFLKNDEFWKKVRWVVYIYKNIILIFFFLKSYLAFLESVNERKNVWFFFSYLNTIDNDKEKNGNEND